MELRHPEGSRKVHEPAGQRIVGHNLLIGHAHAVKIHREEFEPQYGGQIGIHFARSVH